MTGDARGEHPPVVPPVCVYEDGGEEAVEYVVDEREPPRELDRAPQGAHRGEGARCPRERHLARAGLLVDDDAPEVERIERLLE
jgi:hypothetical protein